MAGARAAASLSLTIGVAFATLVVVGGILAGPTIVDCTHQGRGFGACLREKVQHSWLGRDRDRPQPMPVLSSEIAPPSSEPPVVAALPRAETGWIDAQATEYEPPHGLIGVVGAVEAQAPVDAEGSLAAAPQPVVTGAIGVDPQPLASVALAAPPAMPLPTVSGAVGSDVQPLGSVALIAPAPLPQPAVSGEIGRDTAPSVSVALAAPPAPARPEISGEIGGDMQPSGSAILNAPPLLPLPSARGRAGIAAHPTASAAIVGEAMEPALPTPPAIAPRPLKPKPPAAPRFRNDSRYPNVTVLPPPVTGANSSFATLATR